MKKIITCAVNCNVAYNNKENEKQIRCWVLWCGLRCKLSRNEIFQWLCLRDLKLWSVAYEKEDEMVDRCFFPSDAIATSSMFDIENRTCEKLVSLHIYLFCAQKRLCRPIR